MFKNQSNEFELRRDSPYSLKGIRLAVGALPEVEESLDLNLGPLLRIQAHSMKGSSSNSFPVAEAVIDSCMNE